jgi:hypothetical protein
MIRPLSRPDGPEGSEAGTAQHANLSRHSGGSNLGSEGVFELAFGRDKRKGYQPFGWVAERFKAPVLKTGVGAQPTVGSNPTPSAT